MILALIIVVGLTGLVGVLSKASPLTRAVEGWNVGIGIASILLILIVAGISRFFSGSQEPEARLNLRSIAGLCISVFLVLRLELWLVPQVLPDFWAVEGIYYSTLILFGVSLAKFCRAPSYVASLGPLVLILIPAFVHFTALMTSSAASFQYGPEKPLFAIADFVKLMVVAPLDVAVTWSAWRLMQTFKRPNQASERCR